MTRVVGVVVVCAFVVGSALGYSGNDYLKACQQVLGNSPSDYSSGVHDGMCIGYTQGVIETSEVWQRRLEIQVFCLPEETELDQLIRVALKYLENHPETLHMRVATFIQLAFQEAFPCTGD